MKKIKKLLLFGILTLLGIGSSFGDFSIQYYDLSGDNNFFNIGISMGYGNNPVSNYDLNGNSFSPYFLAGNCYDSLDISCFSPVSSYTMSRNFIPVIRGYYSSNGNNLLFNYYNNINFSSAHASYFFPITSYSIPTSDDFIDVSNGVFARVLSNDSFCFSSGVLANTGTFCTPTFVQIFANYPRTVSSLGTINDSLYSGVNYYKGPVSPAIGNGYSFMFVDGEGWVSDGTITHLSGDFHFRSIYFNGSDIITLNRFLVLKLNSKNYRYNSNSNYNVIALAFDSNYIINSLGYKEYPIFYSIYSCPISSSSVYDCSFVEGGDTNQYFSLGFTGTDSLSYYLTNPNGVKYLDNSFVSNTRILTLGSFSLVLDSTAGDNILDYFPNPDGGGNGNQPTYSGSVSLDNCIETTVYTYSTGSDGSTLRLSHTECLSPEIVESGSYVSPIGTIYYVDSSYNVGNISNPDGTIFDTGFLDVDGLLSIDYYSGLFNGQGFMFGVCPYPKSDYLGFATKIRLGNFYPFMPLNCFISAFQQGVKVHYFDDSGLFPDNHSQLMAGTSHYHKTLFRFFDVLLSIGILLLLSALLRIIKK